ncbi:MAG: hypothetical protein K0U37_06700 [Gammaproteobacteria bacterium]|nr:hypothetical protein [Gammaproteobacteria bacterium]
MAIEDESEGGFGRFLRRFGFGGGELPEVIATHDEKIEAHNAEVSRFCDETCELPRIFDVPLNDNLEERIRYLKTRTRQSVVYLHNVDTTAESRQRLSLIIRELSQKDAELALGDEEALYKVKNLLITIEEGPGSDRNQEKVVDWFTDKLKHVRHLFSSRLLTEDRERLQEAENTLKNKLIKAQEVYELLSEGSDVEVITVNDIKSRYDALVAKEEMSILYDSYFIQDVKKLQLDAIKCWQKITKEDDRTLINEVLNWTSTLGNVSIDTSKPITLSSNIKTFLSDIAEGPDHHLDKVSKVNWVRQQQATITGMLENPECPLNAGDLSALESVRDEMQAMHDTLLRLELDELKEAEAFIISALILPEDLPQTEVSEKLGWAEKQVIEVNERLQRDFGEDAIYFKKSLEQVQKKLMQQLTFLSKQKELYELSDRVVRNLSIQDIEELGKALWQLDYAFLLMEQEASITDEDKGVVRDVMQFLKDTLQGQEDKFKAGQAAFKGDIQNQKEEDDSEHSDDSEHRI